MPDATKWESVEVEVKTFLRCDMEHPLMRHHNIWGRMFVLNVRAITEHIRFRVSARCVEALPCW